MQQGQLQREQEQRGRGRYVESRDNIFLVPIVIVTDFVLGIVLSSLRQKLLLPFLCPLSIMKLKLKELTQILKYLVTQSKLAKEQNQDSDPGQLLRKKKALGCEVIWIAGQGFHSSLLQVLPEATHSVQGDRQPSPQKRTMLLPRVQKYLCFPDRIFKLALSPTAILVCPSSYLAWQPYPSPAMIQLPLQLLS